MEIIVNVTVYKCSYCQKKLFRKRSMEKHEEVCFKNPNIEPACWNCKYIKEKEIIYNSFGTNYTAKGFFCEKTNETMYPPKVQRLKMIKNYPSSFVDQIPMPTTCELKELIQKQDNNINRTVLIEEDENVF